MILSSDQSQESRISDDNSSVGDSIKYNTYDMFCTYY